MICRILNVNFARSLELVSKSTECFFQMASSTPKTGDNSIHCHGLTDDEIQELREIFNLVDLDGGGTISKDELAQLMINMGIEASKVSSNICTP
jgi:hypothetical protein